MLVLVTLLYVLMHFHTIYNIFGLTYKPSAQCQFLSIFVRELQKKVKNKSAQKNPEKYPQWKTLEARRGAGEGPRPVQAAPWRAPGGGRALWPPGPGGHP